MKSIPLTRGYSAVVDDDDYEPLSMFNWHTCIQREKHSVRFYAFRMWSKVNGKQKNISMHCYLLGVNGIDHIDGDGLNNQRFNLRTANQSQNSANMRKTHGVSRYKGVCFDARHGTWDAKIMKGGKRYWIGSFKNEADAAQAYNFKAFELFGEFARLNTPEMMPLHQTADTAAQVS